MIGGRRPLPGRKPADRRVRVDRPHSPYFRYTGPGQLVAREAANRPLTPAGRAWARLQRVVFGRPLANEEEIGERLPKKKALAIFSSDAISSSAYATEEILKVLIAAAAAGALAYSVGVSIAIAILLTVVSLSYRQVCRAYPSGGGAYVVARQNLSPLLGLVAAAALLIDYVMTVAVSTASAIEQIQSIVPAVYDIRIEVAFVSIALITVGNLRGLRESGNIFAIPTYLFLGLAILMVGVGLFHVLTGSVTPVHQADVFVARPEAFSVFLLLKAFAGGSVALTGVEAIANGVPAFKPPGAQERGQHADDHGRPAGPAVHRDHDRRPVLRDPADGARRTVGGGPRGDVGLRRRLGAGAGLRGEHRPDPVPGREHQLQRLPAAGRDPGRGRLHAPPVLVPRRPPGVFVGDRPAGRGGLRPAVDLRRRHARPDPALFGRRVRVLHPVPDRDGQALAHRPRAGLGLAPRSTPSGRC